MSATIPTSEAAKPNYEPTLAPERTGMELRDAAIANLKRKRKFVDDLVGYVAVNGVLWLIWALAGRATDGGIPWPAWVSVIWGFLLVIDAWRAFARWPASLHRPITEGDIERELKEGRGIR